MKSLNKLLVKVFSVMLSIMLLNISAFASRYATINNDYTGPGLSGLQVHLWGTQTNPLIYSNYTESSGNGGVFLIEQGSDIGVDIYYAQFNGNTALNGGAVAQMSTFDANNFQNASFENNSATNGGAIYISDGKLNVVAESGEHSRFHNNTSTEKGGAVYNAGDFNAGSSNGEGGPIYFRFNDAGTSGGAIYNCQNAETHILDYVVFSTNTANAYGGAIYNEANGTVRIGNLVYFIDNKTKRESTGMGGAIFNSGKIITANLLSFEGNYASYLGGAIYNNSGAELDIGEFVTFDNNKTTNSQGSGGAIHNRGLVIIGGYSNFKNNSSGGRGGAIHNYEQGVLHIEREVTFSSNTANGNGGAINNQTSSLSVNYIEKLSTFIGNSSGGSGGAISNINCILNIYRGADFYENSAQSSGGAIYNVGGKMQVDEEASFYNNYAQIGGGAISSDISDGKTFTLVGRTSFTENKAGEYGGAINITRGNFNIGQYVNFSSNTSIAGSGGAIANFAGSVTIGDDVTFNGNEAKTNGGAIYNDLFLNTQGQINIGKAAMFKKNSADLSGGAIYISSGSVTIGRANFNENSAKENGGAAYNIGSFTIGEDTKFNNNSAVGSGGAIFNENGNVDIGLRTQFNNNSSGGDGGAVYVSCGIVVAFQATEFNGNKSTQKSGGAIANLNGSVTIGRSAKFKENSARKNGGAIYNIGRISLDYGSQFTNNSSRGDGGAVYNVGSFYANDSNAKFDNNSGNYGGAIFNAGYMLLDYGSQFTNNSSNSDGGAIYNYEGHISFEPSTVFSSNRAINGVGGAINNYKGDVVIGNKSEFTNNSAKNGSGAIRNEATGTIFAGIDIKFIGNTADYGGAIENYGTMTFMDGVIFRDNIANVDGGGAILNSGTLNLTADTRNVEFTGNMSGGEQIAIYNQQNSTLNLWANKNVRFVFNDKITSNNSSGNTLNVNKSSSTEPTNGTIELNADMSGYKGTVNLYNGTIELCENGTWFGGDLTVSNSPTIDTVNNFISEHNFNNLTINNVLNLNVEADLANAEMDTISATSFGNATGKINVKAITILSDIDENEMIEIAFADDILKDKVESVNKASSRLYNYKVKYDKNTGYFRFINGALTKNMGTAASAIAASAGGAATQSLVANQVFASMDGKTSSGKKASMDPSNLYVSAGDQVFDNSGKIERGLWLKPFVAQETVKIGDADVDNNLYGTLAGIDFPVGEDKQVSFYLGYAGSKQEIEDVKSNQTGYVLGATGMVMKDSWYAGLTANVMFNKASIDTDFGTDDVDMNMFSIAAKAGYNYNITNSFVLEPNLTLVYGVVNSQEYETSQGAQIDSQSISNISVEPQVKAKFEIGNGWQPYGLLGYSANLGSKPTVKTDGVELELDSIDGYVEYGAGVNKDFIGTVWSCYAQVTGRSGGRNGFAGNLGLKYKF